MSPYKLVHIKPPTPPPMLQIKIIHFHFKHSACINVHSKRGAIQALQGLCNVVTRGERESARQGPCT